MPLAVSGIGPVHGRPVHGGPSRVWIRSNTPCAWVVPPSVAQPVIKPGGGGVCVCWGDAGTSWPHHHTTAPVAHVLLSPDSGPWLSGMDDC
jgi:hypothetical protein